MYAYFVYVNFREVVLKYKHYLLDIFTHEVIFSSSYNSCKFL